VNVPSWSGSEAGVEEDAAVSATCVETCAFPASLCVETNSAVGDTFDLDFPGRMDSPATIIVLGDAGRQRVGMCRPQQYEPFCQTTPALSALPAHVSRPTHTKRRSALPPYRPSELPHSTPRGLAAITSRSDREQL